MNRLLSGSLVSLLAAGGIVAASCDDNTVAPPRTYWFCDESERLPVTATADRPAFSVRIDNHRYNIRVSVVRPILMDPSNSPGHLYEVKVNRNYHTGALLDSLPDFDELYLSDGASFKERPADTFDAILRIISVRGYIPADSTQEPGSADFSISWCK